MAINSVNKDANYNADFTKYERMIRENLGDKRFTHSINVAEMCKELSKKHRLSPELAEKACTAGLLHDVMKEYPHDKLRRIAAESDFKPDPAELAAHKLWHGIAGAVFARDTLGIDDADIINAIRFHTTGRANMSVVEKVVYLADKVSADRHYEGVEELRVAAFENLDSAMLLGIKRGLRKVMKKDRQIPVYSYEAYNYFALKGEPIL